MSNSIRGNNVAPGLYFKEEEVAYAAKSLGITSLGVAGETVKGPAFENIPVSTWDEYQRYFGGTSTEKFKDSQYPKYELPFIAKSFLTESKQLNVVRVLGLSGYNAGPAWYIKADNASADSERIVAVLRSRGHYEKYGSSKTDEQGCPKYDGFDKLVYDVKSVKIAPYQTADGTVNCSGISFGETKKEVPTGLTSQNLGRFILEVKDNNNNTVKYAVSLNPSDRDYILTVLGTTPFDSSALIYVEELYDVALLQGVEEGNIKEITLGSAYTEWSTGSTATELEVAKIKRYNAVADPVADFLTIPAEELRRGNLGQTFIATDDTIVTGASVGDIYKVVYENNNYKYDKVKIDWNATGATTPIEENINVVFINSVGRYYTLKTLKDGDKLELVSDDLNNYKERFRSAVTPWFVSQILGSTGEFNVKKLFRFISISDGDAANQEFKVSIEKIYPEEGLFDVVIRDYADSDLEPVVLERFAKCSLIPSQSSYIAKKIGTSDGEFEAKSTYVTVELADDDAINGLVPCGFVGFPARKENAYLPLKYNTNIDNEIRPRKQYFGMSDLVGVDVDVLKYKGVSAYFETETSEHGYTNGFHLDTRASFAISTATTFNVKVNGETGYTWSVVETNSNTNEGANGIPVITTEAEMSDTIYGDVNFRKFTVYPYGGFDGWDIYRGKRTNTDDFKASKYRGKVDGAGENFSRIFDRSGLDLDGFKNAINSDFYAYLAGYRQFANPEAIDINLFATPGIDIINNTLLVDEVTNILEDFEDGRNGDALYVPTTPDKPSGASDAKDDMYTPEEIVELVKDTTISDSYVATYYPWVKYFDQPSETYIMLPPTKDVMRNFAFVDNNSAPWFAAAGTKEDNGAVSCTKAHRFTKKGDENVLYANAINPIVTFAKDGVKVWGNKTLYFPTQETPLTRINVRRLMLRVKKLISGAGRVLVFDNNDGTLERQFRSIVEPILSNVRANRGITDYRLDVLNSAECDDEHEIQAAIHIKPTPTMEWLSIGFRIYNQCTQFTD